MVVRTRVLAGAFAGTSAAGVFGAGVFGAGGFTAGGFAAGAWAGAGAATVVRSWIVGASGSLERRAGRWRVPVGAAEEGVRDGDPVGRPVRTAWLLATSPRSRRRVLGPHSNGHHPIGGPLAGHTVHSRDFVTPS
ncbi:hypothetical protein GCM10023204_36390 [Actinomycetospora succinea]